MRRKVSRTVEGMDRSKDCITSASSSPAPSPASGVAPPISRTLFLAIAAAAPAKLGFGPRRHRSSVSPSTAAGDHRQVFGHAASHSPDSDRQPGGNLRHLPSDHDLHGQGSTVRTLPGRGLNCVAIDSNVSPTASTLARSLSLIPAAALSVTNVERDRFLFEEDLPRRPARIAAQGDMHVDCGGLRLPERRLRGLRRTEVSATARARIAHWR